MILVLSIFLSTLHRNRKHLLVVIMKLKKTLKTSSEMELKLDILEIFTSVQLHFSIDNIAIKQLTGGTSNTIYLVNSQDSESDEKFLFRIYGDGSEMFIDRGEEIKNMKILSEHGLGAKLVAEFENGICYNYIDGRSIYNSDVISHNIYPLVATKMAQMHKIPVKIKQNVLWSRMKNFIDLVPEFQNKDDSYWLKCKQDLVVEYNFLKSLLEDCGSPLVFCHMDLNLPNILFDGHQVHFIDVEYAGCSYAAFDIANHFVEFVGFEDTLDYVRWYPNRKFQISWLEHYLTAISGQEAADIGEVEAVFDLVQQFVLCSHLLWGSWALVQAKHSSIDFDFMGFSQQRFREYARMKSIVIK